MTLQGSSAKSTYLDSDDSDEADALNKIDLSSMLRSEYPDYLFATAENQEITFEAISLILGGGFPNTNWIPVAYYLENYSVPNNSECKYDSFTFGCVYKENVVNGPEIYHVGTFFIDNLRLINMEDEFKYHNSDLERRVAQLDNFIKSSRPSVQIRQKYMNELIQNNVEIIPYATSIPSNVYVYIISKLYVYKTFFFCAVVVSCLYVCRSKFLINPDSQGSKALN